MSDRMAEIEELIEAEKREALAYFESRPFALEGAAARPVGRWRVSWALTASAAAAALAVLTVLASFMARRSEFQPRVEVVEAALRRATVPGPPVARTADDRRPTGLGWTVEAALWRGRSPDDAVEVERIVAGALGASAAVGRAETVRRIDGRDLLRRIERLGGGSLERGLEAYARPRS